MDRGTSEGLGKPTTSLDRQFHRDSGTPGSTLLPPPLQPPVRCRGVEQRKGRGKDCFPRSRTVTALPDHESLRPSSPRHPYRYPSSAPTPGGRGGDGRGSPVPIPLRSWRASDPTLLSS